MTSTYDFDVSISSAVASASGQVAAVAGPLSPSQLERMQRYWSAVNYLTVAQIYLLDNPLLHEPLLEVELADSVKAGELRPDGTYVRAQPAPGVEPADSQAWFIADALDEEHVALAHRPPLEWIRGHTISYSDQG